MREVVRLVSAGLRRSGLEDTETAQEYVSGHAVVHDRNVKSGC